MKANKTNQINGREEFIEFTNKNFKPELLQNKTILIPRVDVNPKEKEAVSSFKEGSIKLVGKTEINVATLNSDTNVIYFWKIAYESCRMNYFINASDGRILFCQKSNKLVGIKDLELLFRKE